MFYYFLVTLVFLVNIKLTTEIKKYLQFSQLNFQGDSGGALQCRIPVGHGAYHRCSGWFLRGITSFGKGCNLHGQPGVYVDLSNARVLIWIKDWIEVCSRKTFNPNRPIRLPKKIQENMKKYTQVYKYFKYIVHFL